ncbi:MFS transporter [Pelosinus propionicus]|nr:MFS transporter [Pelosinus propionicus]
MSAIGNEMKIKNNYFDGLEVTKKQICLFIVVIASYFFENLDNNSFNFCAPAIMASMNIGTAGLAQITSAYYLGNTFGAIFGGIISDIIGRRKTLLISTFLFTTGTIVDAATTDFTTFLVARALTGFGILCMMVVTITYMAEMSPKESRGKWEGYIGGFGYLAAPAIGFISGAIVPLHPEAWRNVFYIGGIGYILLIVSYFTIKESPRWLMSRGRQAEAEDVVSSLVGMPIDLSDAVIVKKSRSNLAKDVQKMFSPLYLKRTIVLFLILCGGVVSFNSTQPWMTTLLKMNGFSMQDSIFISTIFTFGFPLGQFVAAYFADRGGRKIPIAVFGILYCVVTIPFVLFIKDNVILAAILGLLVIAIGIARNFIIHPYVAESLPTSQRNSVTGILNGASRFASTGAQPLVPILFAAYGTMGVFGFAMGFSILTSIIAIFFGWRTACKSLEELNENISQE